MLTKLRRQMKVIFWVVILAFVVTIFYWGAGTYRSRQSEIFASVNGEEISFEGFNTALQQTADSYKQVYGSNFTEEMVTQLSQPVLETLIQQKILLQEAKRKNIRVSDKEVRDQIESFAVFQTDGKFDQNLYLQVLDYYQYLPAQLEQDIRESLILARLGNLVPDNVKISEQEIWNEYLRLNEEIRVSYIYFPFTRFQDKVEIKEEEIANYYKNNQEEFRLPERVHAKHILISPGEEDTTETRAKAKEKATTILAQLKNGSDFGDLAQKYSDDPGSRAKGGDLGFFSHAEMEPTFADAAFALKTPGEISEVVETPYGYHIIQLVEKRPSEIPPLNDVRETIYNRLLNEQLRLVAQGRANEISQQIKNGGGFEKAAQENGGLKDTGYFKLETSLKDLGYASTFKEAAFALKKGEDSSVVEVDNGFCLLQLQDRRPIDEKKFEEGKSALRETLRQQRASYLYQEWYNNLKSKTKIVNNLDKFLAVD